MRARAVAGGLLAVIVGGAAFFLWPSEASRVRARVVAAADAISGASGEGDFDRLARLAGLAKALSPDIVVEAEPGGPAVRGREAVAALASQLSRRRRTAARRAERCRGHPRRAARRTPS